MLTQKRLKEVLKYNPETGLFIWLKTNRKDCLLKLAGYIRSDGYVMIKIDGVMYYAHRLVCLYMTGEFPKVSFDHINKIKHDNRLINLRPASYSEQQHNKNINKNNSLGIKGICKIVMGGYSAYRASININGCTKYKQIKLSNNNENDVLNELKNWITTKRNELHKSFASHT